uniref:Pyrroline-5-carboxylate reductase catalytic N-terminal domain-containing protein n=1 Tax=Aplanochytrium stocchinoi TaxID=215587 RepID=A0A7S3LN11_9STRA|mmetsp:Transcript_3875/g.4831  ORF Transcript_3875/g.4831 Transcript_3875/m.4831 type:complete len:214 (-) Transcript_3875:159-800(-)|eukprot:CAMPEP_0204826532 /NCGR_PEP_ID=MMETSP1346-20131115/4198_1 /ASSEMBLY_ACC=CAM_ASM_000771 /TAXON_ID=215587 /ORGANISM="Aplanochytrium stocchinoi, Strain GSBS06" /LENGTH=213 /DNA_ID=CAMNT_0051954603 /DNA_START=206 /DNA_END=847 /DNA_ORIENTATION=-
MAYKVGVLGSGEVGKTLAKGCRDHGYQTCIASRTREKLKEFAQAENIEFGTMKEAAADSDIIILAVAGIGVVDLVTSLKDTLKNKIVIDACNPIEGAPIDGVVQFFQLPGGLSLMEHLQNLAPDAKFVKAFNSVGSGRMVNPKFAEGRPSMFICGNDAEAKGVVSELLEKFGWDTFDMGGARSAYSIEQLCVLWCTRGFNEGKWDHAFKLLTK